MRTLYLPVIDPTYHERALKNKRGLYNALQRQGETYQYDYLATPIEDLFNVVAALVRDFQPDLMLMQLHGFDRLTAQNLIDLRALKPDMKIANWNGDVWMHSLASPEMLDVLKQVDLQLVANAQALPIYKEHGIRGEYWPIAYSEPNEPLPLVPAYDVLFMGNCYSDKRRELGQTLIDYCSQRNLHLGLFGCGWPYDTEETMYDFNKMTALYRACRVAISDNQFPDAVAAFSNRLVQALYAGAFVLQQKIEGLKEYANLIANVDYYRWNDFGELVSLLDTCLYNLQPNSRSQMIFNGNMTVRQYHNFDVRVKLLMEWIK